jgi:hypothetical protein
MKSLILLGLASIALFAEFNIKDFKHLDQRNSNVNQFSHLENNSKKIDIQELQRKQNVINDMKNTETMYHGDDFLTKEEYKTVRKEVTKINKRLNRTREYILYFTSESVPTSAMTNIMFQTGILQDNGIDIEMRTYFNGFNDNIQDYFYSLKDYVYKKSNFEKKKIIRNSQIKLGPNLFEYFNFKKAPAIVLAKCKGENPWTDNCEFNFLLRGDTSLEAFFDKIKDKNSKYEKYYDVLLANKFSEEVNHEKKNNN